MRERIIHDPGEPVPVRRFATEIQASVARSLLEASGIPSFVQRSSYSEVDPGAVMLVVRRENAAEALALLDAGPPSGDAPGDSNDDS